MSDANGRHDLIDRHLRGELNESEKARLAELLNRDSSAREDLVEQVAWDTRFAEILGGNHAICFSLAPSLSETKNTLPV